MPNRPWLLDLEGDPEYLIGFRLLDPEPWQVTYLPTCKAPPRTPEHNRAIGDALKGRPGRRHSPEERRKIGERNKARPPRSAESRAKTAEAMRAYHANKNKQT